MHGVYSSYYQIIGANILISTKDSSGHRKYVTTLVSKPTKLQHAISKISIGHWRKRITLQGCDYYWWQNYANDNNASSWPTTAANLETLVGNIQKIEKNIIGPWKFKLSLLCMDTITTDGRTRLTMLMRQGNVGIHINNENNVQHTTSIGTNKYLSFFCSL